MKRLKRFLLYTTLLVVMVMTSAAFIFAAGDKEKAIEPITIFWAEWDPANYLQELCNIYTEETGNVANVEQTPWTDFQTKTFTEFASRGDAYDIVVGDSQWLGRGSDQGHYVELTDWIKERGVDNISV